MSAALAEIAVGGPRDSRLAFSDGSMATSASLKQFIETAAGNRVAAAIDDRRGFDIIHRRNAAMGSVFDRLRKRRRFWFIAKNGNDRRKCQESSRQSLLVVEQGIVVDAPKRFLEVGSAVFSNFQQACGKSAVVLMENRCRRSRTASVTASVMLSPVALANCWASSWASLFLMFRLIIVYLSTYDSTILHYACTRCALGLRGSQVSAQRAGANLGHRAFTRHAPGWAIDPRLFRA